ncbi:hypothetical protein LXA43DRAFT_1025729 [Ganoderma leucocontextum]|nr:hypothetical protein LXA43DRAFT_1025729 [Ganoderma leucocontextum]
MRPTLPTHTLLARILTPILVLSLVILRPYLLMPMLLRGARPLIYPVCPLFPRLRHLQVARRAIMRIPPRTASPRLRTTPRESPGYLSCAHLARRVVRHASPRLVPRPLSSFR